MKKRRKVISTSLIRADVDKLQTLPMSKYYELTFFKEQNLREVLDFLKLRNARFGIHAPFIYRYKNIHPNPTSHEEELRNDTYEKNKMCAWLSKALGADYIVVHFPNARQRYNWLSKNDLSKVVLNEFRTLNEIITVRIENVYMNDYFNKPEDYIWFASETGTTLCIDIGHLLIDGEFYRFSPVKFIEKCASLISEVHVYYADLKTYERCHHAPWGESKDFREILEFVKDLECDITIEASPDCPEGLMKLLEFFESLD